MIWLLFDYVCVWVCFGWYVLLFVIYDCVMLLGLMLVGYLYIVVYTVWFSECVLVVMV